MKIINKYYSILLSIYEKPLGIPRDFDSLTQLQRVWLRVTAFYTPLHLWVIFVFFMVAISDTDELFEADSDALGIWAFLLAPLLIYWIPSGLSSLIKFIKADKDTKQLSLNRDILINILLVLAIIALVVLIFRWITF